VEGHDLKAELQKLDAYYSAFPEDVKAKGFYSYATVPPEDTSFLTTQLWDKYLPAWRHKDPNRPDLNDLAIQADIMGHLKKYDPDLSDVKPHDERNSDNFHFVTIQRRVRAVKGKWRIFPKEAEERMRVGQDGSGEPLTG
jgi:hypothetical protein